MRNMGPQFADQFREHLKSLVFLLIETIRVAQVLHCVVKAVFASGWRHNAPCTHKCAARGCFAKTAHLQVEQEGFAAVRDCFAIDLGLLAGPHDAPDAAVQYCQRLLHFHNVAGLRAGVCGRERIKARLCLMDLVEQFLAAFEPVLRVMCLLTLCVAVVRRLQTIAFEQYPMLATLAAFMVHIFCRVLPPRLGGGTLLWQVPFDLFF